MLKNKMEHICLELILEVDSKTTFFVGNLSRTLITFDFIYIRFCIPFTILMKFNFRKELIFKYLQPGWNFPSGHFL